MLPIYVYLRMIFRTVCRTRGFRAKSERYTIEVYGRGVREYHGEDEDLYGQKIVRFHVALKG